MKFSINFKLIFKNAHIKYVVLSVLFIIVALPVRATELESIIRELMSSPVKTYGPNCWNSALNVVGANVSVRSTTKPEFWFWMKSPFCKKLGPDDKLKKGDVGSLFWKNLGNYHSFINLNEKYVFSKDSPGLDDKYEIKRYEEMFHETKRRYAQRCRGTEYYLKKINCELEIVYHRCEALPLEFMLGNELLSQLLTDISGYEDTIEKYVRTNDHQMIPLISSAFEKLGLRLVDLLNVKYTGNEEFMRKAITHRIVGNLLVNWGNIEGLSVKALNAVEVAELTLLEGRKHVPRKASDLNLSR
ncbi:MAG: hypothetical protein HOO06_02620 [Bdellovibrionaceae bacterium]|jgi:hypothetical protein|nr:hypothetical protein [Pseudobdellovibrionaceae bacterium]